MGGEITVASTPGQREHLHPLPTPGPISCAQRRARQWAAPTGERLPWTAANLEQATS